MGETRIKAERAEGSAHRLDLYLRRHLPQARQRRGARPSRLQHLRDESTACGDRQERRPERACSSRRRPGRLAYDRKTHHPGQYYHRPLAREVPRTQPGGERLAVQRDNWLSNRIFKSYDDIVDHCCDAWNKLIDQPWRIMSIGLRDWAHKF